MNDDLPRQYRENGFLIALIVVGVFAIGFAMMFRSAIRPEDSQSLGKQFPPIEAKGWANGEAPKAEDLRGHVLVVDAWAFWCGPCRALTPSLIELHKKYKDRGVIFIGLTSHGDDPKSLRASLDFVKSENVPWLNGFAATTTLTALEVEAIPQIWVVDRHNNIVFHQQGLSQDVAESIDQAIVKGLASAP